MESEYFPNCSVKDEFEVLLKMISFFGAFAHFFL